MTYPFRYKAPDTTQAQTMEDLSGYFSHLYEEILEHVEGSAERTLAIRKLQEARMWVNAAILGVTIS